MTESLGAELPPIDVVVRERVRAAGELQGVQGEDAGRERFAGNQDFSNYAKSLNMYMHTSDSVPDLPSLVLYSQLASNSPLPQSR